MKRISIKDVAREAGVSTTTVSYVLHDTPSQTISALTIQRVKDAVRKLNYVPNQAASSLRDRKTNLIGVVIPQTEPGKEFMFSNPFYGELLSQIEYSARLAGYHILLTGTGDGESYINIARNRGVDGIIIIGAYPDAWLNELHDLAVPVVLVDTYVKDPVYHTIGIDDRNGGRLATEYLINHGHREIAFLGGQVGSSGVVYKRFQGYEDALNAAGIELKQENLFCGSISFEYAEEAADEMVARGSKITAVFATADIMGMGLIRGLQKHGLRVPEDISVIGFDDVSLARMSNPPMTTVHQDIQMKGRLAVQYIMESLEGDETKKENILPISIVERESVRNV